ncbi:MAG: hypothetical protein Q7T50_01690, partial [Candidatus Magasanikbacteria bacterium]|nr:hypothetical protein [Candidatus Magasanikbacteria bacterium]
MDKKIYLGLGAVATVVIIGGAIYSAQTASDKQRANPEQASETSIEDKKKIEELYWEELQDAEKYSFCSGVAKIQTDYFDPVMNNKGNLTHVSKEVIVYDKKAGKLFIMAREIEYNYEGTIKFPMGDLTTEVPVKESGSLSEAYSKKEMPERLSYQNSYVFSNPDTKKKDWVYSTIGDEVQMTDARTGCAGAYVLDNAPGKDVLVGGEQIMVDRSCDETDISGTYSGDFSFECTLVDYRHAKEMFETVKLKEALPDNKNDEVFNQLEENNTPELNDAS